MSKTLKQAWTLIRRNPMQSLIVITGTAVTLAFVMVVVINFHLRVADSGPEQNRSRMMYIMPGVLHRTDGTDYRHGLGKLSYERLLEELPGVEKITWYGSLGHNVCSLTEDDDRHMMYIREAGEGWFDFFDYDIIAANMAHAELTVNTLTDMSVGRFIACFAAAVAVLALVIMLAVWPSARKAMMISPAEALHDE